MSKEGKAAEACNWPQALLAKPRSDPAGESLRARLWKQRVMRKHAKGDVSFKSRFSFVEGALQSKPATIIF